MKRKTLIIIIISIVVVALSVFAIVRFKEYRRIQKSLEEQIIYNENYHQGLKELYGKYPWIEDAILENNKYSVGFDDKKEKFIADIYTTQNDVDKIKKEIIKKLKDAGVPTDKYPFEWRVYNEEQEFIK